jgi:predicted  nucleic acid-binding Zn-ribbon protein
MGQSLMPISELEAELLKSIGRLSEAFERSVEAYQNEASALTERFTSALADGMRAHEKRSKALDEYMRFLDGRQQNLETHLCELGVQLQVLEVSLGNLNTKLSSSLATLKGV